MNITVEISYYPLTIEYEQFIIEAINFLKSRPNINVFTHAMSTFIKGDSKEVFTAFSELYDLPNTGVNTNALIIKVINKSLPIESGFLNFNL